jgi:hypothetical protein
LRRFLVEGLKNLVEGLEDLLEGLVKFDERFSEVEREKRFVEFCLKFCRS